MLRIPFDQLQATLAQILLGHHFTPERASRCAQLFTETTRDGVYTHGVKRFPRFIEYIQKGYVRPDATPETLTQAGPLEQWDGRQGPGNLNAYAAMHRAIELSRQYGLGCVALRNTNHWMRGGTYGWQAADAGCVGICFTNTLPNLPAWGGREPRLGNNPFVLAVPRAQGHVVLDTAMSLYSYGKLESYRRDGKPLPFEGGFDEQGQLTRDPGAIMQTMRPLPIGYWKGSGLSLLLDLIAAVLSQGLPVAGIGQLEDEYRLSQVFLCVDVSRDAFGLKDQIVESALAYLHDSSPATPGEKVYYPGEKTLLTRLENQDKGVPVEPDLWAKIQSLGGGA